MAEMKHLGEGNYLGKSRRNFYLSAKCWSLMHECAMELGINHSNVRFLTATAEATDGMLFSRNR